MSLDALVAFVQEWRQRHPRAGKDALVTGLTRQFMLTKQGALLVGDRFVVRVSQNASDTGFPNAVVAFKRIIEFDERPLVVCLLTPGRCNLYLANTTFVRKVSHSSRGMSDEKIVGSILGSDIAGHHGGIANSAENLGELWSVHQRADHGAHRTRIIAATRGMVAKGATWTPSAAEIKRILASPGLAQRVGRTAEYASLAAGLDRAVQEKRAEILAAARDGNAKTRGDRIEQIVTGAAKSQGLGDLSVRILATTISIDIKSKRLDLSSAPKAYNIDKALRALAEGNRLLAILFVGVDLARTRLATRLVSVFDQMLIDAARVDGRWSGPETRGTVQFSGGLDPLWREDFVETIDVGSAQEFLRRLLMPTDVL